MLNRIDILCCLFNFTPPQGSSTLSMIAFAIFDMELYFSFFQTLQPYMYKILPNKGVMCPQIFISSTKV